MANILVFGASIAYGCWDKKGGWVQRIKKLINKKNLQLKGRNRLKNYHLVYNLSISGETTEDVLKRFEFETKPRLSDKRGSIFILPVGTNDSQFVYSEGKRRVESGEFEKNLSNLIALARKFTSTIVFVGPSPVDEKRADPIPWFKDRGCRNKDLKEYNEITKRVCQKEKAFFIEIFSYFEKLNYKKLLEDGLHPNSEGHRLIFEIVKNYLIKNKII